MNFIIVDLEATCWEKRDQSPNEIIEIGAICVGKNKKVLEEFNEFVKPKIHPKISEFCTQLTSITQAQVDTALEFPEVLEKFQNWIQHFGEDYLLCSWGFYDRVQFKNDCVLHELDTDWLEKHISLKHQYQKIRHLRRPIGMKKTLKKEKMPLEGFHHRGIDDVRNIVKIFLKYFDEWKI